MKPYSVLVVFSTIAVGLLNVQARPARDKPNVVVILADDMGYECLGANGSTDYKTPEIDRLAAEGIRFEQFFAEPKCTPSRVELMTGLYNVRNYVNFGMLDRSQTTFAHQLKKVGYATAIAGKWQLGTEIDAPQHFGFEEACLWQHTRPRSRKGKHGTRYPNPQLEINGKEVDFLDGEYGPDVCSDFLCDFIEENKEQPFLAYYSMILPHWPFEPTPASKDWDPKSMGATSNLGPGDLATQKKHFSDMVRYTDTLVGKVVGTLDRLDIRENTIVIFAGDNGTAPPIVSNWKGRHVAGGKGKVSDWGTRAPLVINWPGIIKPAVEKHELVEFSDMLPTLCELSGAPMPEGYPGDGVSLLPLFLERGDRNKSYIYSWYKGKTWARTVDYGVLEAKGRKSYQVFPGHFEEKNVEFASIDNEQREIYLRLETVIDDLAKTRPDRLKTKKVQSGLDFKKVDL